MASPSLSENLGGTPEAAEFGAALRDMRLAHNADISTVASTLRIRQVYLQAIEDGRFDDLPGPTYAAGFVRAYAEFLGLEIPEVMRRYREVTRDGASQAPLVAPSPVSEGRMPTGFILLMAAVLAGIAYGSWYYMTLNGRDAGDLVAQIPQKIADIVGMERSSGETPTPSSVETPPPAAAPQTGPQTAMAPSSEPVFPPAESSIQSPSAEQAVSEPAPAAQETGAETVPAAETAPMAESTPDAQPGMPETSAESAAPASGDAMTTVPLPADAETGDAAVQPPTMAETAPSAGGAETAAETTAEPPAEPVSEAPPPAEAPAAAMSAPAPADQVAAVPPAAPAMAPEEPASRIVLRATAISWVELRDAEGKRIFSRLLKKGETYNVPPKSGITLATGNAGALDILVDGRAISSIGPLGAVRRDIILEPEALLRRGIASQ